MAIVRCSIFSFWSLMIRSRFQARKASFTVMMRSFRSQGFDRYRYSAFWFTRLTTGYSKRLKNHAAAVALSIAYYNFCRVHEAIRTAPAVALGVTDHVWTIAELIDAALSIVPDDEPGPGPERAPAPAPVLTPPAAPAPLPALSLPILPTHVQRAAKLRQAIAVIQASAQLSLFAEGPAEATAAKAGG